MIYSFFLISIYLFLLFLFFFIFLFLSPLLCFLINNLNIKFHPFLIKAILNTHTHTHTQQVSAVVHLTHLFLQPMLGRNFGYLIFVSSVAGLAPTPNYQVYGAAKSFVRMFSLSLRTELEGTGVYEFLLLFFVIFSLLSFLLSLYLIFLHFSSLFTFSSFLLFFFHSSHSSRSLPLHRTTSVVCPPHSTTGFQEVAHQPKDLFFNVSHVPADEVVSASINAAENGEAKVIPGWKNKVSIKRYFKNLFF